MTTHCNLATAIPSPIPGIVTAVPTSLSAISDMPAKAVIIRRNHRSTSSDSAVIIHRNHRSRSVGIHSLLRECRLGLCVEANEARFRQSANRKLDLSKALDHVDTTWRQPFEEGHARDVIFGWPRKWCRSSHAEPNVVPLSRERRTPSTASALRPPAARRLQRR